MKHISYYLIIIITLMGSTIQAEPAEWGKDVLSCEVENQGWRQRCKVAKTELPINNKVEVITRIYYEFSNCTGSSTRPDYIKIGILDITVNKQEMLKYGSSGFVDVIGRSNYILIDNDPVRTATYTRHNLNCKLLITKAEIIDYSESGKQFLQQIATFATDTINKIPAQEQKTVKLQANMISFAGQKESFACMIESYDKVTTEEAILTDLKNQYNKNYNEEYQKGRYTCPPSATLEDELNKCGENPEEIICVINKAYDDSKQWFRDNISTCQSYIDLLDLGEKRAVLENLKIRLNESLTKSIVGIKKETK